MGLDALDAVGGVDVLDHGDLVAGSGALARDDGGVGEEELPDLEGSRSVKLILEINGDHKVRKRREG